MAVNLVSVTTINRVNLYQGQPSTSNATLYTTPALTSVKLASIVATNTTTTAANFTLDVVPSGGTAGTTHRICSLLSVGPSSTTVIDSAIYLSAGDFIAGLQGTSSALTLTISGETYA